MKKPRLSIQKPRLFAWQSTQNLEIRQICWLFVLICWLVPRFVLLARAIVCCGFSRVCVGFSVLWGGYFLCFRRIFKKQSAKPSKGTTKPTQVVVLPECRGKCCIFLCFVVAKAVVFAGLPLFCAWLEPCAFRTTKFWPMFAPNAGSSSALRSLGAQVLASVAPERLFLRPEARQRST